MRLARLACLVVIAIAPLHVRAQSGSALSPDLQKYVRVQAPRIVLTHVRVIDGTGAAAVEDQNIVIEGGKIYSIQPGADVAPTNGATVIDLRGSSLRRMRSA